MKNCRLWVYSCVLAGLISFGDLTPMFARNRFETTYIAHGGIGIINNDLFVSLRESKNALYLASHRRWEGADFKQTQVVVTDGHRVLPPTSTASCTSLCVVIFCPTEVHFVDYASGRVGKYERQQQFFGDAR
jgi:hypothetical protein